MLWTSNVNKWHNIATLLPIYLLFAGTHINVTDNKMFVTFHLSINLFNFPFLLLISFVLHAEYVVLAVYRLALMW